MQYRCGSLSYISNMYVKRCYMHVEVSKPTKNAVTMLKVRERD